MTNQEIREIEDRLKALEIHAVRQEAIIEKVNEIHQALIAGNPSLMTRIDRLEQGAQTLSWTLRTVLAAVVGLLIKTAYEIVEKS